MAILRINSLELIKTKEPAMAKAIARETGIPEHKKMKAQGAEKAEAPWAAESNRPETQEVNTPGTQGANSPEAQEVNVLEAQEAIAPET